MSQEPTTIEETFVEKISSSFREPNWLKQFRMDALDQFNILPEEKSNLYTKYGSDIKTDFASLTKQTSAAAHPAAVPIAEIAAGMESGQYYVTTQTETIVSKNVKSLESKGVVFCDYHEALEKHEGILKSIFENKAIKPSDDKYAALNSALFSSGWLLYVPKHVRIEDPLRIRSYLNSLKPLFTQTWIYAEDDSEVSLLTENYGAEIPGFASEIVEAYLQDGSSVYYSNIQDYSQQTTVLSNSKALCGKDAQIYWTVGYFGGRVHRSRSESIFLKDGAGAEDVEVVFGNNDQKFDLVSDLSHVGMSTKGRILSNSVLNDKAQSVFKGMIRIGKEAKNSNAYLAGHAILLSENSRSDAIPGLEILTNDVKATHSASVSQIDDDQIFYMMTRGLSESEAKKFIVLGFLEPAISRIRSEELRDTMRDLIEAKWYRQVGVLKHKKREVLFEETQSEQVPKDIFEGHYKYR
ncbi:MAG: SufD family Fe-S cluster assembly protein [Nitrososphaerota archaeon]|nr:SufD family Fe-S cluster assembly protein [Nitrososphaerota archaeon]